MFILYGVMIRGGKVSNLVGGIVEQVLTGFPLVGTMPPVVPPQIVIAPELVSTLPLMSLMPTPPEFNTVIFPDELLWSTPGPRLISKPMKIPVSPEFAIVIVPELV